MPTQPPTTQPSHWTPDDWQKVFLYAGAFLGVLGTFLTAVLLPAVLKILTAVKELKKISAVRDEQVHTLDSNVKLVHASQQAAADKVEAIPNPTPLQEMPPTPKPVTQSLNPDPRKPLT